MLPIENINYWLCILLFIIPGTIIFSIRSLFIPIYDRNGAANIFRFIMYSSWNLLITFLLIYFFAPNILMQKTFNLVDNFKVFILYIFILPIVEGIIWSYINTKRFNKDVVRPLFNSMKLNIINPAPTAWDSLFYNDSEKIVEIIFNDNTSIIGFLGVNSFVSSENHTRDIYLEKILERNEDNTYKILDNCEGILVNEEKIKYIKLFKVDSSRDEKIKKLYFSARKIKDENKKLKEENTELKKRNQEQEDKGKEY